MQVEKKYFRKLLKDVSDMFGYDKNCKNKSDGKIYIIITNSNIKLCYYLYSSLTVVKTLCNDIAILDNLKAGEEIVYGFKVSSLFELINLFNRITHSGVKIKDTIDIYFNNTIRIDLTSSNVGFNLGTLVESNDLYNIHEYDNIKSNIIRTLAGYTEDNISTIDKSELLYMLKAGSALNIKNILFNPYSDAIYGYGYGGVLIYNGYKSYTIDKILIDIKEDTIRHFITLFGSSECKYIYQYNYNGKTTFVLLNQYSEPVTLIIVENGLISKNDLAMLNRIITGISDNIEDYIGVNSIDINAVRDTIKLIKKNITDTRALCKQLTTEDCPVRPLSSMSDISSLVFTGKYVNNQEYKITLPFDILDRISSENIKGEVLIAIDRTSNKYLVLNTTDEVEQPLIMLTNGDCRIS